MLLDTIRLPEKDIEYIYSSFKKERDLLYAEKSVFIMGEKRRMWCIARAMVDHSGNAVGFIESMRDMTKLHKYANLTPREIQIASLVKEGKRTKEIAEILTLSPNTIINYRKNLRKKWS